MRLSRWALSTLILGAYAGPAVKRQEDGPPPDDPPEDPPSEAPAENPVVALPPPPPPVPPPNSTLTVTVTATVTATTIATTIATTTAITTVALAPSTVPIAPLLTGPTDMQILNYVLTVEQLQANFFNQSLSKYTSQDFVTAGLPPWARARFGEISSDENRHVSVLKAALGNNSVAECTYNFTLLDPRTLVQVGVMLETISAGALTIAAHLLGNKDYVTVIAALLATEARGASWIQAAIRHGNPLNAAFETPLGMNQTYSLISSMITSCPANNTSLLPPLKAFPTLRLPDNTTAGLIISLDFTPPAPIVDHYYAAFVTGMDAVFVQFGTKDRLVRVPDHLRGIVFVLVTGDNLKVDDSCTVAGPAYLYLPYDSSGSPMSLHML